MTATPNDPSRRPADSEIDVFGLTHLGLVRKQNQDHFLIMAVHKHASLVATSVGEAKELVPPDQRLAMIAMVADGVGSGDGELASRVTVERAMQYTAQAIQVVYGAGNPAEQFIDQLQAAIARCHAEVLERRVEERRKAATTLTLWIGVWPHIYVVQVGDSRYYLFKDNQLRQVTRDQTVAQDLFDAGALSRTEAFRSPLAHVLSSAIGGEHAVPVVTKVRSEWGVVHLLCSDGLTKHVSDERIAERLRTMTSCKQACETLLQDALDDGGTDNVTIVIGRAVAKAAQ